MWTFKFDWYFCFCLEYPRFSQKSSTTAPIARMSRTCKKIPTSHTLWAVSWLTRGPSAVTVCTEEKFQSLAEVSMFHWLDTCTLRTGDTSKMLSKGPGQTQVSIEVLQITYNNVFVNDLRIRAAVYIIPTEAQWTRVSMYMYDQLMYVKRRSGICTVWLLYFQWRYRIWISLTFVCLTCGGICIVSHIVLPKCFM